MLAVGEAFARVIRPLKLRGLVVSLSAYAFSNLNLFMGMTSKFSLIFASADRVIDMLEFPELDIKEGSLVTPRILRA